MKKQAIKSKTAPKKALVKTGKSNSAVLIGGGILLLAGLGTAYYFYKKRKKKKQGLNALETPEIVAASPSMQSNIKSSSTFQPITSKRFKCNSSSYPLEYGTCHADVKILQRYLKFYKENLGKSGSNSDGVDGQFGNLTLLAAKKRLSKSSFSKSDIEGMKNSVKMIKG